MEGVRPPPSLSIGACMPIFLFKSILSLFILLFALIGMYTMFEVFGRPDNKRKFSVDKLKKLHKVNGYLFLVLYLFIAYLCMKILIGTRAEPSSRVVFHSVFALSVILLLALKILFNRVYRQNYGQIRHIGLVMALLALGMVGTSGGYYLAITKFGTDLKAERAIQKEAPAKARAEPGNIQRGKELYESECTLCHDPISRETIVGPGHEGILKREKLPVSGREATPENVRRQLQDPYNRMPSFDYLTEQEISDLTAYLNTL
jgi:mono/diheme cytochrome c family protein